jgi:hypothetical protein
MTQPDIINARIATLEKWIVALEQEIPIVWARIEADIPHPDNCDIYELKESLESHKNELRNLKNLLDNRR